MLTRKTALVLGAGSSTAFGYPVGAKLRSDILELANHGYQGKSISAGLYQPANVLQQFVDEFKESQLYSIDRFLARRGEYADIGKRAIAKVLLACERRSRLFNDDGDLWLRYLFNQLESDSWEKVDLSNLSVISFNYDRSFEHYLMSALMRAYGRGQQAVLDKLRTMNIVHIYGTLGPVWPDEDGYLPYGAEVNSENVRAAANSIRIIPEGRADSDELIQAQQWLAKADAIVFLGFGFDSTNLARLNALETCREGIVHPTQGHMTRPVVATCKGMTDAERRQAHASCAFGPPGTRHSHVVDNAANFIDCDCLDLLRRTLVLK